MSRSLLLGCIIVLVCCTCSFAGGWGINLQNNFGDTDADLEKLLGSPYYDPDLSRFDTQITDSGTFFYKGVVQVFFPSESALSLGAELGINHLYYWEERYYVPYVSNNYRFRSDDIWTFQIGGILEYMLTDDFFIQGGVSSHNYFTASGSSMGIMTAFGYTIRFPNSPGFSMPLQIRYDIIDDNADTKALSFGLGLQFHID